MSPCVCVSVAVSNCIPPCLCFSFLPLSLGLLVSPWLSGGLWFPFCPSHPRWWDLPSPGPSITHQHPWDQGTAVGTCWSPVHSLPAPRCSYSGTAAGVYVGWSSGSVPPQARSPGWSPLQSGICPGSCQQARLVCLAEEESKAPFSLPSLPLIPLSPQSCPYPASGPKGMELGFRPPTHLKLFRVKLVDRWLSGPGSHWQMRLFVVRFMRQDRLWGLAGGSAHKVGRMRPLGGTTRKAGSFPLGVTLSILLSPCRETLEGWSWGKSNYRHVWGQATQSFQPSHLRRL